MSSIAQYKGTNHTKVSIWYQDNDANGNYGTWVVRDNYSSTKDMYYFNKKMAYLDYNRRVKAIKAYSKAYNASR